MTDPGMSVAPYAELTFDADGDVDGGERDRLLGLTAGRTVRDLVVFAHGWNNDRSTATALYRRFFTPFPALAPAARIGYVGVVWPSMRFCDEPVPDFPHSPAAGPAAPGTLDPGTRAALAAAFPGRATVLDDIAGLLESGPRTARELEGFGTLVRQLVAPAGAAAPEESAADTADDGVPGMFSRPAAEVCGEFAEALAGLGSTDGAEGFALPDLRAGALELLRQATYWEMKRRAGTVGERGLGPLVGRLASAAPDVRVHLVGHSFGGRLVSFALRGLPAGVRAVRSVTLLQGAFSHYAFASGLPGDAGAGGVLRGREQRVGGPLVCCFSRYDAALGTFYPLASRAADDDRSLAGVDVGRLLGPRWGAMGHDGVQGVPGVHACTLAGALAAPLPESGWVNVDAAAVVRRGGPPSGAHSDIVHPELARLVLAAGRIR
ncbi:serine-threonine protein kinase [Streptomyces tropicalis]|uniref:Serine-threonine protein kinase n=1 Tax=Streptomyces tropicalis TaxID=3034234 RepID=A0ABT6A5L6_9ACTN|nr:serine-threonine protein kinase [Streptomyces tropicalis]MDF3299935.1 serine-threonine protein kinase [Streptomyces tropicalis]